MNLDPMEIIGNLKGSAKLKNERNNSSSNGEDCNYYHARGRDIE